jgi:hypothetical protein
MNQKILYRRSLIFSFNANLFDIDAEIEEVLVFARHRLAIQTSSLTRQNALKAIKTLFSEVFFS